jgi:hypothetical protein
MGSKAPSLAKLGRANWRKSMGGKIKEILKLQFDKQLRLEFHSANQP